MAAVDNPSGAHTDTLVTDNDDGTYSVSYTPFEEGIHKLSVKFGGDDIPGSPFKVSFQLSGPLPVTQRSAHRRHRFFLLRDTKDKQKGTRLQEFRGKTFLTREYAKR